MATTGRTVVDPAMWMVSAKAGEANRAAKRTPAAKRRIGVTFSLKP